MNLETLVRKLQENKIGCRNMLIISKVVKASVQLKKNMETGRELKNKIEAEIIKK